MPQVKRRWSSLVARTFAALSVLLPLGAGASGASLSGELRILQTELIAVGDHYLRIEAFAGAAGEIRIENRTAYVLVVTIDTEAREEQLGPGATAVWRCDRDSVPLLSMDVRGADAAPLQALAACDRGMRVTRTQFPT